MKQVKAKKHKPAVGTRAWKRLYRRKKKGARKALTWRDAHGAV
jgi:hypothetical protein